MKDTSTTRTEAVEFAETAKLHGFRVAIKGFGSGASGGIVVTVQSSFDAGNVSQYAAAEHVAGRLLALAPQPYPGSTWGTDSGSVGGHAGLSGGYMRLSKSGVSARFASRVAKLLGIGIEVGR